MGRWWCSYYVAAAQEYFGGLYGRAEPDEGAAQEYLADSMEGRSRMMGAAQDI